ncbi:MAG: aminoglycoside 3'-phosphotransferase [Clostridia bacterium]|nr:aminoglycoside 3'-phosphotransferase [Clostridia bacterium]
MKRTPINLNLQEFPEEFHSVLESADVFDSSCSEAARVYFLDVDDGLYLKVSAKGSLKKEALMTDYFHSRALGAAEVVRYLSNDRDWLLTTRVAGEDCTHADYLADPKRLCDLLAQKLRELHETDFSGCPIPDHTANYLATADHNFKAGIYDAALFPDNWGYRTAEEAWQTLQEGKHLLKSDTLLHGDYCLPNVMLDRWRFSGFIDLGNGGVGDRHVDLFWGAWTLNFNLHTDKYRERFFDAYGRDRIDEDILRIVAAAEVFG